MAARGGIDFLLAIEDSGSPGTYITLGGLRSKSLSFNKEEIDASNHGSNDWKEILAGAGLKSMSVSGSGIWDNANGSLSQLRSDFMAGTIRSFRLTDGDATTYTADFSIATLETAGEYNGEQTWSISLNASGGVTIA